MVATVKCADCGTLFDIGISELAKSNIVSVETNEKLVCTSYKCHSCGKVHNVQLDNESTCALIEQFKKLFEERVAYERIIHKSIPKKMKKKYKRIDNELRLQRYELMCKYNSKPFVRENGEEFILECVIECDTAEEEQSNGKEEL